MKLTVKEKTKVQCKGCRKYFVNGLFDMDGSFDLIQKKEENPKGLCMECFDKDIQPIIDDPEGMFYCPHCKVRTNEKTIWTTCSRCKTPLIRGGERQ